MAMETIDKFIKLIHDAGILGILIFILVGGYRKWWVFGWVHDGAIHRLLEECRKSEDECKEWRAKFLSLVGKM